MSYMAVALTGKCWMGLSDVSPNALFSSGRMPSSHAQRIAALGKRLGRRGESSAWNRWLHLARAAVWFRVHGRYSTIRRIISAGMESSEGIAMFFLWVCGDRSLDQCEERTWIYIARSGSSPVAM